MKIALCSSATYFDKLPEIKKGMEERGYEIFLPSMDDYHWKGEDALAKIQYNLIRQHFDKIDLSDAIYVANYEKNNIPGYIGGNTFLEMGIAFYRKIPIFLMNNIPNMSYREELRAMDLKVIGKDYSKLDEILKTE